MDLCGHLGVQNLQSFLIIWLLFHWNCTTDSGKETGRILIFSHGNGHAKWHHMWHIMDVEQAVHWKHLFMQNLGFEDAIHQSLWALSPEKNTTNGIIYFNFIYYTIIYIFFWKRVPTKKLTKCLAKNVKTKNTHLQSSSSWVVHLLQFLPLLGSKKGFRTLQQNTVHCDLGTRPFRSKRPPRPAGCGDGWMVWWDWEMDWSLGITRHIVDGAGPPPFFLNPHANQQKSKIAEIQWKYSMQTNVGSFFPVVTWNQRSRFGFWNDLATWRTWKKLDFLGNRKGMKRRDSCVLEMKDKWPTWKWRICVSFGNTSDGVSPIAGRCSAFGNQNMIGETKQLPNNTFLMIIFINWSLCFISFKVAWKRLNIS